MVTFVSFDMETLFYDEVSNRCLMLGMCLTPLARTQQTRCDNKHMNHNPKWKIFVLECDKAGMAFLGDCDFKVRKQIVVSIFHGCLFKKNKNYRGKIKSYAEKTFQKLSKIILISACSTNGVLHMKLGVIKTNAYICT